MTLQKAIKMIEERYKKAKKNEWINNPLAYALHDVWKEAESDGKEVKRMRDK